MAAALTFGGFVKRFPEFAAMDQDSFDCILEEAERNVSACAWGSRYGDGLAYLSAHMTSLGLYGGDEGCDAKSKPVPAGPIQLQKFGGVTVGYKVSGADSGPLSGTQYGRHFLWLQKRICRWAVL